MRPFSASCGTAATALTHTPVSYLALCTVCGAKGMVGGLVEAAPHHFPCPRCRATLRYRAHAAAILAVFGAGVDLWLSRFARGERARELRILEIGLHGPLARELAAAPLYRRAYLFPDVPRGAERDGVRSEDLEGLTLANGSVDLLVTHDVLGHVLDLDAALAEIARVLSPRGAHVFAVPMADPAPETSRVRARRRDGAVEHLAPPLYGRSGLDTPSLVVTEFGRDLLARHRPHGLAASVHRSQAAAGLAEGAVVVARPVPPAGPPSA